MYLKQLGLGLSLSVLMASVVLATSATANSVQQNTVQETTMKITPQTFNQNPQNFMGKKVVLTGKIDRILGNGSYIIRDSQNSANRVLIFTASNSSASNMEKDAKHQQAGTKGVSLKEGDSVRLVGKVEQFNVSSEVDSFSPKSDTETINQTSDSTPVLVIQPGDLQRS